MLPGKMNAGTTVHCPNCRHEFELSALMRAELEAQLRVELSRHFEGRATALKAAADARVRETETELAKAQAKLATAASKEADLLRMQRELADRERTMAVETELKVNEAVARARAQEAKLAEQRAASQQGQQQLRDEEHRQKISGLEKTIAELTRKVQQGSQQVQGEAQEVVLRELLVGAFPVDAIDDVPKGVNGADLVQGVRGHDGRDCGAILWETKRTQKWSDGWLPKLRDDLREAGAACAVLVTQALPPDIKDFGPKDGVWVCAPSHAVSLAAVLRGGLVELARTRRAAEGSGQKMQVLYTYINGTDFRNRVGGLVEALAEMQNDLCREKRAAIVSWKRREKFIERAFENAAAFTGDLQGIVGGQLQDLLPPAFESAPALPAHAEASEGTGAVSDEKLQRLFLDLLPGDGTAVGNVSLLEQFTSEALTDLGLAVGADDYERCKEALLMDGRIRRGKGRGGSVSLVLASAAE
jgi:hypothetical protein